jgi:hypothetical protein
MEAVLDHGDIDVDDVAILQFLVAGNAVAHHVIDRRAQRRRIRCVPGWRVVERGGNRVLHVDHVVVGEVVDGLRRDIGFNVRRQVVQQFRREAAGNAHALDFFRRLEMNGHRGSVRRAGGR